MKHKKLSILIAVIIFILLTFRCSETFTIVQIEDLPEDTAFLCLIADNHGKLLPMNWSLEKVFRFSMHPDKCIVSLYDNHGVPHIAEVDWIDTDRIGILRKTKTGTWHVAWFDRPKSSRLRTSRLFRHFAWHGSWSECDFKEDIPPKTLRELGFDYALKEL